MLAGAGAAFGGTTCVESVSLQPGSGVKAGHELRVCASGAGETPVRRKRDYSQAAAADSSDALSMYEEPQMQRRWRTVKTSRAQGRG